jgi:hypothetical protein
MRLIRWDDPQFVLNLPEGTEICREDCVELRDEQYNWVPRSFTLSMENWVRLAEHILWERDRRKAEAAKQPKRWVVNLGGNAAKLAEYQGEGLSQDGVATGCDRDSLYVWAHSEKEAIHKAAEADHSLGVWVREYLSRD